MEIDLDKYFPKLVLVSNEPPKTAESESVKHKLQPVPFTSIPPQQTISTTPGVLKTKTNVDKIIHRLRGTLDMKNKQPGMLPAEHEKIDMDLKEAIPVTSLIELWMKTYAVFIRYVYLDIGLEGTLKEPDRYVHKTASALTEMKVFNHHVRLSLVYMLDIVHRAHMHIRNKHKEILKIGMSMNIVEVVVPNLVQTMVGLGFDNRVICLATNVVDILTRIINITVYPDL